MGRGSLASVNVRVLIDGPSELVFDYAAPEGMVVQPGCRVRIPLRRKSATGTVLAVVEPLQSDFALTCGSIDAKMRRKDNA